MEHEHKTYTACAKVEDGIVTQVIVCRNVQWAIDTLGGEWHPSYDDNPAGTGYTWDGEKYIAPVYEEVEDEID